MAEMQVNKQSVREFLASGKSFLVPEYQRPYSWKQEQCETLWEDIMNFFKNTQENQDSSDDDEYFLGSVVSFIDENNKNTLEIIDGQQRITTLSLLFRALYEKANGQEYKKDETKGYIKAFGKCLWKFDEGSEILEFKKPHLTSRVVLDSDNEILQQILSENIGDIKQSKSLYARNFIFFCERVDEFVSNSFDMWGEFCKTILNKLVILPIECNNQENAMRIFTTLNDRGMPLSDSDIIKGRIYASIQDKNEKEAFASKWKELESNLVNKDTGEKYFVMDFLFVQYMHITRARNLDSSNEVGLRRFYTTGKYKNVLKDSQKVMQEIEELQELWLSIDKFENERLNLQATQMFDTLYFYPSDYWKTLVSVYYFYCKDKGLGFFSEKNILPFLRHYVATLFVQYVQTPSRNNIRILIFNAYVSLYKNGLLDFGVDLQKYLSDETFKNLFFERQKIFTAFVTLHLYLKYPDQEIINGEIEHIFPQKWQNTNYNGWNRADAKKYLEQIGNKMWLEKKINIQAGNGYFGKKKEKYKKSEFLEARALAEYPKDDWTKEDIEKRNEEIYITLKAFFEENV
ncbi:MAG: DUF262 domain-containing HNH endonuclease family protein [Helicobacter sp.]|nr:DUF262 domain-containing HNH endonuclease family protein [Helicobacter sp.]